MKARGFTTQSAQREHVMIASHLNLLAVAGGRVALVLATVLLTWGPLAGVAEGKGWGAHQAQVTPPMHARPAVSGPVLAHPMMAPHLALSSSLRRMRQPGSVPGMTTLRFIRGGAPRIKGAQPSLPLRTRPSRGMPGRAAVRWPVAATAHPLWAGTLGRNAPLARVVREERIPVLEALRRAALRR